MFFIDFIFIPRATLRRDCRGNRSDDLGQDLFPKLGRPQDTRIQTPFSADPTRSAQSEVSKKM